MANITTTAAAGLLEEEEPDLLIKELDTFFGRKLTLFSSVLLQM